MIGRAWGVGLLVVSLWVAGCAGASSAGRTLTNGPPAHFVLRNTSPFQICYIYISPASYSQWGPDWLGPSETLLNVSRTFDINEGAYDIRFDDCRQRVIYQRWAVDIHDGDVIEFHESHIEPHR
jgi:hypothetical protein